MSKYWSDFVKRLNPYKPGEQPLVGQVTKLNTNENPYGPSPKVLSAIETQLSDELRLYPPPGGDSLKQAIARYLGLKVEQVFLGNGSDEVLAHVFNSLLKKREPVLFPDITYSFYPDFCQLFGIQYKEIPLNDNLGIDVSDYIQPNGGIIFPNPNAPTGLTLPLDKIEWLLESNRDSVVVIDEAYIDFGGLSAVGLINKSPNLIITQTMSKSRSLAGMRIGYALGSEDLIEGLDRVKNSFNSYPLGNLQISAGVAAINDHDYFIQTCQSVIASRTALSEDLQKLGFEVIPSLGNFVFIRHSDRPATEINSCLIKKGIFTRHFSHPRINNFLRITVGTEDQHKVLISELHVILS